ncbi:MAG: glycosyl hydrolase [Bacteroidetes bacterium]|nr:glycosyl hydrolase [Bacteroidota bacterium]
MRVRYAVSLMGSLLVLLSLGAWAQRRPAPSAPAAPSIDPAWLQNLEWRNIGPAIMGGRTTDIEGVPGNPNLVYVATASGGLWKTTNGGHTWIPLFDAQPVLSIGDIAIDPRNPDLIYVGTGEGNPRNSVSFGNGVYKSTDGGKTWQHLGLGNVRHITRVLVHPQNPDVVYVGALGSAFGPTEDRGVFMTTDGGKTWQKVLYLDSEHGVSDMDIDPQNPNILYAALWKFERKPWTHTSGSEKGGLWRSVDGGRTWKKLEQGLPRLLGRIGVKVAPSNPSVVYVIAESNEGILFRSEDRGESFREVSRQRNIVSRGFYYTDIRVDPTDENRIYALATQFFVSIDGGRTFRQSAQRIHVDHHALWIDPVNPHRMWLGNDGGIAVSYDRGETWQYVNNIPLGQFYHVWYDFAEPFYNVVGGLQDNGTWAGPSRTRYGVGVLNDDWQLVSFGDGFQSLIHPDNPNLYLTESQGGNILRTHLDSRAQQSINPAVRTGGGPARDLKVRFNWNAPIVQSPHDKNTVYFAGNVVFKSTDFGQTWEQISPDLTTNDPSKLGPAGGPVWKENTTAEYYCTIISLEESPVQPGVIWVGTDDGLVHVTLDGGRTWTNVTRNIPGVPAGSPVSAVEPSRTGAGVAYVAFDRHMFNDFRPYVFKTTDFGRTWTNVTGNLPEGAYVHVVREDPRNPNLVYVGTETGLYASYTGGGNWIKLHLKNLPQGVSVHDVRIHPRENDLIIATHGRSLYIFDDATVIQQLSPELAAREAHLFPIRAAVRYSTAMGRYGIGDAVFSGPNPPYGALITYYLKEKPDERTPVRIQILDGSGRVIRELTRLPREKGLNRVAWDLRHEGPRPRRPPQAGESQQEEMMGFFGGGPAGPHVLAGTYTVRLLVGDRSYEQPVEVRLERALLPFAERIQVGFQRGMELRELRSTINDFLRALDGVREQAQAVERTLRAWGGNETRALLGQLEAFRKKADSLEATLLRPQNQQQDYGPRLAEQLNQMAGMLDNNLGPTPYQLRYYEELKAQVRPALEPIARFLASDVAQLNEALRRANAPVLMVRAPSLPAVGGGGGQ